MNICFECIALFFNSCPFYLSGIHAREWISPATATYIISELVENVDLNRDILEFYDIYVLPIMNPDG